MFSCVFSQGLMRFKDEIMEKIRNHHSSKDIDRVLNSKSNPRYRKICSFNVTGPEDYLQFRALNLNKLTAVSRLRVAINGLFPQRSKWTMSKGVQNWTELLYSFKGDSQSGWRLWVERIVWDRLSSKL
ncbi:unnamed protein product [Nezara viridula]|uniref:Uncharacterized protein n=1 Tax=Nezara viridula TaxID=85310 RepID=A0A9P0E4Y4_NEZVI|nr:unnamed protein product [Nezara viridula]